LEIRVATQCHGGLSLANEDGEVKIPSSSLASLSSKSDILVNAGGIASGSDDRGVSSRRLLCTIIFFKNGVNGQSKHPDINIKSKAFVSALRSLTVSADHRFSLVIYTRDLKTNSSGRRRMD